MAGMDNATKGIRAQGAREKVGSWRRGQYALPDPVGGTQHQSIRALDIYCKISGLFATKKAVAPKKDGRDLKILMYRHVNVVPVISIRKLVE